ncbi:MAG: type II toxin-antitoxin system HicA family toxin [Bryobacterales bacterium]|nr:type II toxin-antitoxin system HicA family toxin [Acidobacteriota bacterium]MCB9386095.1 type II toxin-antitoxin system HicA family toxin [Bryobacterales bacterium]
MASAQLKRWLAKRGCTFSPGKGGHLIVALGDRRSTLPMHGKQKDLGTGLVEAIKKQLGLQDAK